MVFSLFSDLTMTETTKTSIFSALALVLVAVAALTRPTIPTIVMDDLVGKALFPKFTDPLAVRKLEIARPDASGTVHEFRIAEVDGVWSIPSHENYPADAKDQMGRVAEALYDLKVLDIAASLDETVDSTSLHTMYGVIDPTSEKASLGEGIGVKVTLTGEGDEKLVDVIVGKEVDAGDRPNPDEADEPAESGKMRYVRVSGQVPVYVVEIDPERFSARFDQWIEKNLLDINTYDVKEIFVDEYSLKIEHQLTQRGLQEVIVPTFSGDMTLGYDGSATGAEKWSLKSRMGFRGRNYEYYARPMKPDQELNVETLDAMISALNDLKIVNVTRKPASLAAALREGKTFEEIAPEPLLRECGFFLAPMPDLKGGTQGERTQLLSNEGDVQLRMKDGIRYNLRFGDLSGTESELESETGADSAAAPSMGTNRYLFITAEFDASAVAAPELRDVPEVPEGEAAEGTSEEELDRLKKEKEDAELANKRERERHDDAVEAGKKRAVELTDRFADWFYVIPEDVYKKIHLTESNVFREKAREEEQDKEHGQSPVTTPWLPDLSGLPGLEGAGALNGPEPAAETPRPDAPKSDGADETKPEPAAPAPPTDQPADPPTEKPGEGFDPFGGVNPTT